MYNAVIIFLSLLLFLLLLCIALYCCPCRPPQQIFHLQSSLSLEPSLPFSPSQAVPPPPPPKKNNFNILDGPFTHLCPCHVSSQRALSLNLQSSLPTYPSQTPPSGIHTSNSLAICPVLVMSRCNFKKIALSPQWFVL